MKNFIKLTLICLILFTLSSQAKEDAHMDDESYDRSSAASSLWHDLTNGGVMSDSDYTDIHNLMYTKSLQRLWVSLEHKQFETLKNAKATLCMIIKFSNSDESTLKCEDVQFENGSLKILWTQYSNETRTETKTFFSSEINFPKIQQIEAALVFKGSKAVYSAKVDTWSDWNVIDTKSEGPVIVKKSDRHYGPTDYDNTIVTCANGFVFRPRENLCRPVYRGFYGKYDKHVISRPTNLIFGE